MAIKDFVEVNITRETVVAPLVAFGVPMLFSNQVNTLDRIKFYSDLDAVSADFDTASDTYIAASKVFAQTPPVERLGIGRRAADDVDVQVTAASVGDTYTITVNGTDFDYTVQVGDTVDNVATALATAVTGGSEPVSASATTDTVTISADVSNTVYSVNVEGDLEIQAASSTETIAESLTAIINASDSFYAIVSVGLSDQDYKDVDSYIQTNTIKKIQAIASDDTSIWTSGTTDVFSALNTTGNNRTFGIAHRDAGTEYPHAGAMGEILTFNPGSASLAFKSLNDVAVSQFSSTERDFVRGKNGSTYETRAGQDVVYKGDMFGGTAFDIIVGQDWLETTISEDIFEFLVNQPKVPYTDPGTLQLKAILKGVLDLAVQRNVILDDYVITRIPVADVSSSDRENGEYKGLSFTATFAGSVTKVVINGTISF